MSRDTPENKLRRLAIDIVAAHVSHNVVTAQDLPDVIQAVYAALITVNRSVAGVSVGLEPAVPVKKSVFPGYIVCLEDGKKLTMLKRHLATNYNMTPDEYRARWGLMADYPMVAPNYAAKRSTLARRFGLGRKPESIFEPAVTPLPVVEVAEPEMPKVVVQRIPERKRGRKPGSKNRVPDQLDHVSE